MWQTILIQPLTNALVFLTGIFGSLGWAIIILTIFIRLLLLPLLLPTLKSSQKIKKIAPELEKLKKKYRQDKTKLAQAQMALYQKEGINPASGCLPTIIQMIILIALYQVFIKALNPDYYEQLKNLLYPFVKMPSGGINLSFWYLNLNKPDLIGKIPGFFLVTAAIFQLLTSKLTSPAVQIQDKAAKKTPEKSDDMAVMMQKQFLFTMPLMTIFIGFTLPAGVTLYWFTSSLVGLIQQYLVSHYFKTKNKSK